MRNSLAAHRPTFLIYGIGLFVICFFAPKLDTPHSREMIALTVLGIVADLWLRASLLLHTRGLLQGEERSLASWLWHGAIRTPLFALYCAIRLFATMMGLVLLVLPGLAIFTFTCLVPALCLLAPPGEGSWFSQGWRLAWRFPKRVLLITWLPTVAPLMEVALSALNGHSPPWPARALFSLLEAAALLWSTIDCVRLILDTKQEQSVT